MSRHFTRKTEREKSEARVRREKFLSKRYEKSLVRKQSAISSRLSFNNGAPDGGIYNLSKVRERRTVEFPAKGEQ